MSIFKFFKTPTSLIIKDLLPAFYVRTITTGKPTFCSQDAVENENTDKSEEAETKPGLKKHPVETCIAYMDSEAYKKTYGDFPVWHFYVRNFKGSRAPRTRKNCWAFGRLNRGSPCPICRDQYLLPHYLNVKLLKQFISPHGGNILDTSKTGVCQKQQMFLEVAIKKAQNYGLLTFTVPHRSYDYSLYNKK